MWRVDECGGWTGVDGCGRWTGVDGCGGRTGVEGGRVLTVDEARQRCSPHPHPPSTGGWGSNPGSDTGEVPEHGGSPGKCGFLRSPGPLPPGLGLRYLTLPLHSVAPPPVPLCVHLPYDRGRFWGRGYGRRDLGKTPEVRAGGGGSGQDCVVSTLGKHRFTRVDPKGFPARAPVPFPG